MNKISKITLSIENANLATGATIEGLCDAIKQKDADAKVTVCFDFVAPDANECK